VGHIVVSVYYGNTWTDSDGFGRTKNGKSVAGEMRTAAKDLIHGSLISTISEVNCYSR
jgi:hypothetical protein